MGAGRYVLRSLPAYGGFGMTRRGWVREHKAKLEAGHSRRYNIRRLGYWEEFGDVEVAIAGEKG